MSDRISIAIADGMADVLLTRLDKMMCSIPQCSMRWPKLAIGSARSGAAGRRCAGGINACRSSSVRGTRSEAAL
jgi:hypothetical protein